MNGACTKQRCVYLIGDCDSGWVGSESSCYYISDDNHPASWNDARTYCQSVDAILVSIGSSTENEFLSNNTPSEANYWAGANDMAEGKELFCYTVHIFFVTWGYNTH